MGGRCAGGGALTVSIPHEDGAPPGSEVVAPRITAGGRGCDHRAARSSRHGAVGHPGRWAGPGQEGGSHCIRALTGSDNLHCHSLVTMDNEGRA